MIYATILLLLIAIAVVLFVQIQYYMEHPNHKEWCDEWFARFEQLNRKRFTDPDLAWRYEVLERAFHKNPHAG